MDRYAPAKQMEELYHDVHLILEKSTTTSGAFSGQHKPVKDVKMQPGMNCVN